MKADPDAPATHYRLAPETWKLVVEEYLAGATAKEVAAKWRTSAGSVYRWARELHPGSKRGAGTPGRGPMRGWWMMKRPPSPRAIRWARGR
ncbi:MAG: hypothetical protein HZY74_13460 [Brevundimonas sp.]|nr:MAG: hypothetical protein HZY74_13460 [Brevundimonas sp.]